MLLVLLNKTGMDIFWTYFGHILDMKCTNVSKVCPKYVHTFNVQKVSKMCPTLYIVSKMGPNQSNFWTLLNVSNVCPKYVQIFGHILDTFWTHHLGKKTGPAFTKRACKYPKVGHILDTIWTYFGHIMDTFWTKFGHITDI